MEPSSAPAVEAGGDAGRSEVMDIDGEALAQLTIRVLSARTGS